MFDQVVTAADREDRAGEGNAIAVAHAGGIPAPAGRIEQRVGGRCVATDGNAGAERIVVLYRAGRRRPESGDRNRDEAGAVERQVDRVPDADVVERWAPCVEEEAIRDQHGIVQHAKRGIACGERGHGGRNAGHVEIAADETGELGGRFIHDGDHESAE